MPIRNQIEAITQTLSTPVTFVYGTANELNQLADDSVFPVVFMYPLQPIDVSPQVNGSRKALLSTCLFIACAKGLRKGVFTELRLGETPQIPSGRTGTRPSARSLKSWLSSADKRGVVHPLAFVPAICSANLPFLGVDLD